MSLHTCYPCYGTAQNYAKGKSVWSAPIRRILCAPHPLRSAARDRHPSWPTVARRLVATHPHTQRAASLCAYLVLLRAEIARFTRPLRRLVSVALILTSRWGAVSSCAALCSPDVPPAPQAGRQRRSGVLHTAAIIAPAAYHHGVFHEEMQHGTRLERRRQPHAWR